MMKTYSYERSGLPRWRDGWGGQTRSLTEGRPLYLAVLMFVALAPLIRELGGLLYFCIFLVCCTAVVVRKAWIFPNALLVFIAVGAFYVAASYAGLLPRAWTQLYDPGAIPQQAAFVVTFYFFVAAGRIFWIDLLRSRNAKLRLWLLILAGFLGPALLGIALGYFDLATAFRYFFRALSNPAMMGYLALGALIFLFLPRWQIILALLLTPFMAILTPFLQNTLAAFAFLGLAITSRPRASMCAALLLFLSVWLVSFGFVERISDSTPTLGVRLNLQADAIDAILQTLGIGVGFGTEAVRPKSFLGYGLYLSGVDIENVNPEWILIGTHNSFIGLFFRLGLIGGLAFLWFFFISLFPMRCRDLRVERLACFAYFILFLLMFSNPAIESPAYHVGAAFAMGLLLALRELTVVSVTGRDARDT